MNPVLSPANKANNRVTTAKATPSKRRASVQLCEQAVHKATLAVIHSRLGQLYTACSPAFSARVHEYLNAASPTDRMMLDAWSNIGHQDAKRSPRVDILRTNEQTMTPLGVACLISYARGWIDEQDARTAAPPKVKTRTGPSSPTKDQADLGIPVPQAMQPARTEGHQSCPTTPRSKHPECPTAHGQLSEDRSHHPARRRRGPQVAEARESVPGRQARRSASPSRQD